MNTANDSNLTKKPQKANTKNNQVMDADSLAHETFLQGAIEKDSHHKKMSVDNDDE